MSYSIPFPTDLISNSTHILHGLWITIIYYYMYICAYTIYDVRMHVRTLRIHMYIVTTIAR